MRLGTFRHSSPQPHYNYIGPRIAHRIDNARIQIGPAVLTLRLIVIPRLHRRLHLSRFRDQTPRLRLILFPH